MGEGRDALLASPDATDYLALVSQVDMAQQRTAAKEEAAVARVRRLREQQERPLAIRASILWTPRGGHIRVRDKMLTLAKHRKFCFAPDISHIEYNRPPPPRALAVQKKPVGSSGPATSSSADLRQKAEALRLREQEMQTQNATIIPPVSIQLGLHIVQNPKGLKHIGSMVAAWDKGKGEMKKAELRLNLRSLGIDATSAEADALFDSWECAALPPPRTHAIRWSMTARMRPRASLACDRARHSQHSVLRAMRSY